MMAGPPSSSRYSPSSLILLLLLLLLLASVLVSPTPDPRPQQGGGGVGAPSVLAPLNTLVMAPLRTALVGGAQGTRLVGGAVGGAVQGTVTMSSGFILNSVRFDLIERYLILATFSKGKRL